MLKDRLRVAKDIAEKLTALEAAIDDALACAGDLTTSVSSGRQKANLSAVVGQDAIGLTGDAMQSLYSARASMVEAHDAFACARDQIGLRTFASGDLWKPNSPSAANEQHEIAGITNRDVA